MTAAKPAGVVQVMGEMDPEDPENGGGDANHRNSDATHNIGSLTGWQAIAAGVRCLVHGSRCVRRGSVLRGCQHGGLSVCCVRWRVS